MGKLVLARSLVDLALFTNVRNDQWGYKWHSDFYNSALFRLGFKVYHNKDVEYGNRSNYKSAIDDGLFEYRKAE